MSSDFLGKDEIQVFTICNLGCIREKIQGWPHSARNKELIASAVSGCQEWAVVPDDKAVLKVAVENFAANPSSRKDKSSKN